MFCESCGKEIPNDATFCSHCGKKVENRIVKSNNASKEKNMILALLISFILTGLGIAYAGNLKKGILLFAAGLICNLIGLASSVFAIIGIVIWAYALYETYNEVEKANGNSNPNLIEDIKGFPSNKKIASIAAIAIILLIVVSGVSGALSSKNTVNNVDDDYEIDDDSDSVKSTPSSSSSSSGSSGGDSYSSSSNGHDVSSHYEGEHGSSDTHGTVYDDGSVESHQKGHTDYGDYKIDSYMDSNGNIHGTVDVGGQTYHVSS